MAYGSDSEGEVAEPKQGGAPAPAERPAPEARANGHFEQGRGRGRGRHSQRGRHPPGTIASSMPLTIALLREQCSLCKGIIRSQPHLYARMQCGLLVLLGRKIIAMLLHRFSLAQRPFHLSLALALP